MNSPPHSSPKTTAYTLHSSSTSQFPSKCETATRQLRVSV